MSCEEITPDIITVKGTWHPVVVWRLRQLLAQREPQLSFKEIAATLQRSKNAVIGKCHRERYPEYEARSEVEFTPYPPTRNVFPTKSGRCLWPHGHPGEDGFGFCGAPTASGQVFCREHRTIAYLDRPKDAATPELYE